jgi:hypothetical protein
MREGIVVLLIAALTACNAPSSHLPSPERAYRQFFAARASLAPLIVEQSSTFQSLLSDPSPPTGQQLPFADEAWPPPFFPWDAVNSPTLNDVACRWVDDSTAFLVARVDKTADGVTSAPRIAVLVREEDSDWRVALEDAVWDSEWRVLDGPKSDMEVSEAARLGDCLRVEAEGFAVAMAKSDDVGGDPYVPEGLRVRMVHATDRRAMALVDFTDSRSYGSVDSGSVIGINIDRTLLVSVIKDEAARWICTSVRGVY